MPKLPHTLKVALALVVLYSSWGSSYIANHFAIADLPPFLMTGARMLLAALLMFGIARFQGDRTKAGARDLLRHFLAATPLKDPGTARRPAQTTRTSLHWRRSTRFRRGWVVLRISLRADGKVPRGTR